MERICVYWARSEEYLGEKIERISFALFEDDELIYFDNASGVETMRQLEALMKTKLVSWLCSRRKESLDKAPFVLEEKDNLSSDDPLMEKVDAEIKDDRTLEVEYSYDLNSACFTYLCSLITRADGLLSFQEGTGSAYESVEEVVIDAILERRLGKIRQRLSHLERDCRGKVEILEYPDSASFEFDLYYTYLKAIRGNENEKNK